LCFPHECKSVGDLARAVAAYNAAALAREGGKLDSGAVWQALVQIVAPIALTPKSEIDRETTFFGTASA
jgi:hypothetical protein